MEAFDSEGQVVERFSLSYDLFYEELHPLIDSDAFRAERGIRRVKGTIYNSKGSVQSQFDNLYDIGGAITEHNQT